MATSLFTDTLSEWGWGLGMEYETVSLLVSPSSSGLLGDKFETVVYCQGQGHEVQKVVHASPILSESPEVGGAGLGILLGRRALPDKRRPAFGQLVPPPCLSYA